LLFLLLLSVVVVVLFFIYLELFGIVVAVTHTPRRSKKKRTGATSTNIILSILHDFFSLIFFELHVNVHVPLSRHSARPTTLHKKKTRQRG
jgi:hypothetical protein